LVNVCPELLDEALHDRQASELGCNRQGCRSIVRGFVDIGTELLDETFYDRQVSF
jgi:hypothetical protein